MAHALEALGVNIIEAGFAIASDGDFRAIEESHGKFATRRLLRWRGLAEKISRPRHALSTKLGAPASTSSLPVPTFIFNSN